jgi:nucleotide-binding universal stress UspA family protein
MRRVLVEIGDRPDDRDALALATALCERTGAELVVEGQPGPVDLIASGRLPEEAPAAVAVAPSGLAEAELRLQRVAVGHDGSRESARALSLGGELARRLGSSLTILGVVEVSPDLDDAVEAVAEEQRIAHHLERALESVPAEVVAESRLLAGVAAEALLGAATAADLIVLGSRSQFGPRPRMRPGSVGASVAIRSPCPTVIATA